MLIPGIDMTIRLQLFFIAVALETLLDSTSRLRCGKFLLNAGGKRTVAGVMSKDIDEALASPACLDVISGGKVSVNFATDGRSN